MLRAGLWRLSQNRLVPTVFCVDSQTTAGQAMGTLDVTELDLSYRLLRAVFQTLQHGLPPEHLHVHHVRAHAGDPYNELVDYAAKQESQRSFNLPRVSINMQEWHNKLPHLWLCFSHPVGQAPWNGGLAVHSPALPSISHPSISSPQRKRCLRRPHCHLSLATMNVQSTSHGPNGHGGKLLYLYDQVKAYGLNIVGYKKDAMMSQSVLPTRSTASMPDTKVDNMELKCGSTCSNRLLRTPIGSLSTFGHRLCKLPTQTRSD